MNLNYAVLFYSQYSHKSLMMKQYIEQSDISFEFINVDKKGIKKILMEDDVYNINEIPSVLLIYKNNEYTTLYGQKLNIWFQQLIHNINTLKEQQQQEYQARVQNEIQKQTVRHIDTTVSHSGITQKKQDTPNRPMPAPGNRHQPSNYTKIQQEEPVSLIDLGGNEPPSTEQVIASGGVKQKVGSDTPMDVKAIQEQLIREREQMDEKLEENKPFI